ncbi:hypothetical protein ACT453_54135, partial [Bacillus sp. D-CC]
FQLITGHWAIISFFIALCIVLWLLRTDIRDRHLDTKRSTVPATIGWIFIGFFLAFFSQSIAGKIKMNRRKYKGTNDSGNKEVK